MMRVAVVTGATGGIGRWIARGLAEAGLHVVMVGRDAGRGAAALGWLLAAVPGGSAELMLADLSLLAETRALAARILAAHPRIAVLVNNAGVFRARREETAEGQECVLATNHLAPFVLTAALEPALLAGAAAGLPSRLVTVGSDTADRARIVPGDLGLRRGWGMKRSYASAKLATTMATLDWAERWAGRGVVAHVVHPGLVATGLVRSGGVIGLAWRVMALWARTERDGARTPLRAALDPAMAAATGLYLKEGRAVRPNPLALDRGLRAEVRRATERLIATTG